MKKTLIFCIACLFLLGIKSIPAQGMEVGEKIIRVGAPIQAGLFMKDAEGNLSGYTYDYLMEMSQYTGCSYEFVFVDASLNKQILTLMEMLKNGEIDLLGSMKYDEILSKEYSYSGYSYGNNYYGIFVPKISDISEKDLYDSQEMRVGVHSKSMRKHPVLEQFTEMNNWKIEQVLVENSQELYDMLESGQVDAILSTDLAMAYRDDISAIARFLPQAFYFATTKGNIDVIQQINHAIDTIDQVNSQFTAQLYNKYFVKKSEELFFTEEEENFIKQSDALDVVMYNNKAPFQYTDKKTGKVVGITVEILEYISNRTGLKFRYNMVSTYDEYAEMLENGMVAISADAFISYKDAIEMQTTLTLPWYSMPIVKVFLEETDFLGQEKYAVPYFLKNVVKQSENAAYYDTLEECIEAVKKGEVKYSYAEEICSQYLLSRVANRDLKRISQTDIQNQKICFGIRNGSDIRLLSIFNKAIMNLPSEDVSEIVYLNTTKKQEMTLAEQFQENKNIILICIMACLILIVFVYFCAKARQQKQINFENKRYSTLSNLANEYFYEYNIKKDELILSEKCADYFETTTKIPQFYKRILEQKEEDQYGIWQLGKHLLSNEKDQYEISCKMPDESKQWFRIFSSDIVDKKREIHTVGKITNIHDEKIAKIRLEQDASLDGLTRVYNIYTFKRKIRDYIKNYQMDETYALLIFDVDSFKEINDNFGHFSGDAVLSRAAELLREVFPLEIIGRLGGDEFIVFTKEIGKEELERRCKVLCKDMQNKTLELLGIRVSWSIGITFMQTERLYEELYKEADSALYKTKMASKNGYTFFELK